MRHGVLRRRFVIQYGTGHDVFRGASYQRGHGVFRGAAYQGGHGLGKIFGGLFRSIMPLFMDGARAVGRQALHSGVDILKDAAIGKNLKQAVADRLGEGIGMLGNKVKAKIEQTGRGGYIRKCIGPTPAKQRKVALTGPDIFRKHGLNSQQLSKSKQIGA